MTEDIREYSGDAQNTESTQMPEDDQNDDCQMEELADPLPDIGTELGQNAADTVDRIVEVAAEKAKPEPTDIELLIAAVRAVAEEVHELRMVLDMTNYHIGNLRPS